MTDLSEEPLDSFEDDDEPVPAQLVLDIDGFEGPIDVLLSLARDQKVDLTQISILQLADQFLDYVRRARRQRLELAADYLVMAAWLAYLKSRLLLPEDADDEDGPTGEELAEALALQLRRLEAMREAATQLMARDLLGRDVFRRGGGEGLSVVSKPIYEITFNDLLGAYADHRRRQHSVSSLRIRSLDLMSLDEAINRLSGLLGVAIEWTTLERFMPDGIVDPLHRRSMLASTFAASLELAREGKIALRQAQPFAPLFLRATDKEKQR